MIRLFRLQTLINAELKWEGTPHNGLDSTACGEILAIVREALINTRKHACASRVVVTVNQRPAAVELTITDNGDGFTLAELRNVAGQHQGIRNMQERARLIGGHLDIESAVGRGTTVRLVVPCPEE
jgi:nitrate/nitrite-specific signal transduction histidine kinase